MFRRKKVELPTPQVSAVMSVARGDTIPRIPDVATASEKDLHNHVNLLADGLDSILKCSKMCVDAVCNLNDPEMCEQIRNFSKDKPPMEYMGYCRSNFGKPECINATAYIRELESFLEQLKLASVKRDELNDIYSLVERLYKEIKKEYRKDSRTNISKGGDNVGEIPLQTKISDSINRSIYTFEPPVPNKKSGVKPRTYTKHQNLRRLTKTPAYQPPMGTAEPIPNVPLNPEQLVRIGPENKRNPTLKKNKGSRTLVNRTNTNLNEPNTSLNKPNKNLNGRSAFGPTKARLNGAGRKTQRRRRNQS